MVYTMEEHAKVMDDIVRSSPDFTPDVPSRANLEAENERLRYVLRLIAEGWGPYGKWPVESRCTVAIHYEDQARLVIDPEYAKQQKESMEMVAADLVPKWMRRFGFPW